MAETLPSYEDVLKELDKLVANAKPLNVSELKECLDSVNVRLDTTRTARSTEAAIDAVCQANWTMDEHFSKVAVMPKKISTGNMSKELKDRINGLSDEWEKHRKVSRGH